MRLASLLVPALIGILASWPALAQQSKLQRYSKYLAPYVQSPQKVVDRMLELAHLKPGETLYDLGCGDGRILITAAEKYHTKSVGVELSAKLVQSTSERIWKLGLQDQASVIQGDLLTVDLSPADVVTIYLESNSNASLRPNLEKYLKPGSRVISHDYEVPGWKPDRVEREEGAHGRIHPIYVYEMPPKKQ